MVEIKMARVDERLIHAQIIKKWLETLKCNHVVIVDEEIHNNVFEVDILKMSTPSYVTLYIFDISEALSFFNENTECSSPVLLLVKNIGILKTLVDMGVAIKKINIGLITSKVGRKKICSSVYLSEAEQRDVRYFIDMGITTIAQMVPDSQSVDLSKIILAKDTK